MNLPNTYTDKNETGCCAIPNVADWDNNEISLDEKPFIRMYTKCFLFIPLNMSKVMTAIQKTAEGADAVMPPNQAMILSRVISPWKAEQLYAVSKQVEGADNVTLSGTFLTKVFEGPYQNAQKWHGTLLEYAASKDMQPERVFFFYTTCPKCAKHYGKNYTIGLVEINPSHEPEPALA